MGDSTSVEVILNELKHINKSIEEIKLGMSRQCDNCLTSALIKQKVNLIWLNISAIWAVVGAVTFKLLFGDH